MMGNRRSNGRKIENWKWKWRWRIVGRQFFEWIGTLQIVRRIRSTLGHPHTYAHPFNFALICLHSNGKRINGAPGYEYKFRMKAIPLCRRRKRQRCVCQKYKTFHLHLKVINRSLPTPTHHCTDPMILQNYQTRRRWLKVLLFRCFRLQRIS